MAQNEGSYDIKIPGPSANINKGTFTENMAYEPQFYGIRTLTFMPYEPFLLGMGVVFNILIFRLQQEQLQSRFPGVWFVERSPTTHHKGSLSGGKLLGAIEFKLIHPNIPKLTLSCLDLSGVLVGHPFHNSRAESWFSYFRMN